MQRMFRVSIVLTTGLAAYAIATTTNNVKPGTLGPSEADVFFRRFECAVHFQPAAGQHVSPSSSSSTSSNAATKLCYLRRSNSGIGGSFTYADNTQTRSGQNIKGSLLGLPQLNHSASSSRIRRSSTFDPTANNNHHYEWPHIDSFDASTADAIVFPEPGGGRLVFGDGWDVTIK